MSHWFNLGLNIVGTVGMFVPGGQMVSAVCFTASGVVSTIEAANAKNDTEFVCQLGMTAASVIPLVGGPMHAVHIAQTAQSAKNVCEGIQKDDKVQVGLGILGAAGGACRLTPGMKEVANVLTVSSSSINFGKLFYEIITEIDNATTEEEVCSILNKITNMVASGKIAQDNVKELQIRAKLKQERIRKIKEERRMKQESKMFENKQKDDIKYYGKSVLNPNVTGQKNWVDEIQKDIDLAKNSPKSNKSSNSLQLLDQIKQKFNGGMMEHHATFLKYDNEGNFVVQEKFSNDHKKESSPVLESGKNNCRISVQKKGSQNWIKQEIQDVKKQQFQQEWMGDTMIYTESQKFNKNEALNRLKNVLKAIETNDKSINGYSLIDNNCEHEVNYILQGERFSEQVDKILNNF